MQEPSSDRSFALTTLQRLWPTARIETPTRSAAGSPRGQADYLVLPASQRVRVLAPTRPPRAAAAGLARNSAPVSRRQSAVRWIGRLGLRAGLGPFLGAVGPPFPERLRLVASGSGGRSILDHLGDVLGEEVTVVIALGTKRANRKPVLRVMDRRGRTLAFAKIGINQPTGELVRGEARALQALGDVAWTTFTAPRLIDHSQFNGCNVLLMAPVPTRGTKGLRDSGARRRLLAELSEGCGTLEEPIRGGRFVAKLRATLDQAPEHHHVTQLAASLTALEEQSGSAEFLLGAWHGDFTAWNMVTDNGRTHVWDWERFDTRVPAGLDEIHYCVNSYAQQHGFTAQSILTGIRESTWPHRSPHTARLHAATYLVALGTRYVSSYTQEGGEVNELRGAALVEALEQLLPT